MTEKPETYEQSAKGPAVGRPLERLLNTERVPDLLEVATLEAARRQVRQVREMSRRDRYLRPTNARTARRRETSC
jgi:hypothetical protein